MLIVVFNWDKFYDFVLQVFRVIAFILMRAALLSRKFTGETMSGVT